MNRAMIFLALGLALSGCYRADFVHVDGAMSNGTGQKEMHLGLIAGLVELQEVDISSKCGGAPAVMHEEFGIIDYIISYISGNIVVTHTIETTCK